MQAAETRPSYSTPFRVLLDVSPVSCCTPYCRFWSGRHLKSASPLSGWAEPRLHISHQLTKRTLQVSYLLTNALPFLSHPTVLVSSV
jgi:hypothetical protein